MSQCVGGKESVDACMYVFVGVCMGGCVGGGWVCECVVDDV